MYQVKPVGGQSRHIVKGDKLLGFLEEGWGRPGMVSSIAWLLGVVRGFVGLGVRPSEPDA